MPGVDADAAEENGYVACDIAMESNRAEWQALSRPSRPLHGNVGAH